MESINQIYKPGSVKHELLAKVERKFLDVISANKNFASLINGMQFWVDPIKGQFSGVTIRVRKKPDSYHPDGFTYGMINLAQYPACCGYLISWATSVSYGHRDKGLGQDLMKLKIWLGINTGYSGMHCICKASNSAEIHILEKFGWVRTFDEVRNRRTGHDLISWNINLRKL